MKLLLFLALAGFSDTTSREYRGSEGQIRVEIPRVDDAVIVDGFLNDQVWLGAARLTGFSQYQPVDGRPAEQDTEILVWYSPTAIHFGVRAFAAPGTVRATLADRDRLYDEDQIQFFIDTYHDGRQAMVFGVNPFGVQSDGVLVEGSRGGGGGFGGFGGGGGGRERTDQSPDFVFQSKGRLTDYGYEIEVRIPFKSMRYQTLDPQTWGLNVSRRVLATGAEDTWVPTRRAATSFLAQSGTLEGLTGLNRGLVMDLNPFVTARRSGVDEDGAWVRDDAVEVGANIRWGMTPTLTLNGTVNPDFSQVESDASQVVTDPRRALFFPEKRPFFLEGIEQFSTPNNLVYTRRIVAPVGAAKITGKLSGFNLGAMVALDDPLTSVDEQGNPVFAIARLQHDVGEQSRVGLVYTGKFDGDYVNQVGGVDARLVKGAWTLNGQMAGSSTIEEGETTVAPLWEIGLNRTGQHFGLSYSFEGVSDEFVAGSGFVSRRGITTVGFDHSYTLYGSATSLLQRTTFSANVRGVWDYDDFVSGRSIQDRQLFLSSHFTLSGGWRVTLRGMFERFGYDQDLYEDYAVERRVNGVPVDTVAFGPAPAINNTVLDLNIDTPRIGPVSFRVEANLGRDVNYYEWSPADIWLLNNSIQLRPTNQIRLDATYILQSYDRRSDGSQVAITHIPRLRLEYQI
ncbi:MAG TPA: DUF5916 domain-containing protein, partial [Gemmatimonadales bacterium]|nr:DUF5916 domain-containing protein [Gemmatimonadales bacterium]